MSECSTRWPVDGHESVSTSLHHTPQTATEHKLWSLRLICTTQLGGLGSDILNHSALRGDSLWRSHAWTPGQGSPGSNPSSFNPRLRLCRWGGEADRQRNENPTTLASILLWFFSLFFPLPSSVSSLASDERQAGHSTVLFLSDPHSLVLSLSQGSAANPATSPPTAQDRRR